MRTAFLLLALLSVSVYGQRSASPTGKQQHSVTAGCAPSVAVRYLELNNVRARLETSGSLWFNQSTGFASYEIPKGSGNTSMFAGALWMGGTDINGQLKLSAMTYHNGNDYWAGPLNTTTAEIDAATCAQWDQFFKITASDVLQFVGWWNAGEFDKVNGTTTQQDDYPGYSIPESILEYPAHGDVSKGQDYNLAPFYDRDGDGNYNPSVSGDYPYYDFFNEVDCRLTRDIRLFGDETYWWVFNDKGNIHTESNGPSIGMEIRAQAFAFATNDEINDMTFYNYELVNRSSFTLTNTYFGQWVDSDVGYSWDDYVGCDVQRGLGYGYNADNFDEAGFGKPGYGAQPPAVGVDFFEGPYQDNDGVDNPGPFHEKFAPYGIKNITYQDAKNGNGIPYSGMGLGYGDSIVDNERFGMRRFVYYWIGTHVQGDPQTALDYYNYLRGIWRDGTAMLYGGNGHVGSGATGTEAKFIFPGDSDPLLWGTNGVVQNPAFWTEQTAGNSPNGRRFLQSAGPFTLEPGAVNDITVGVVWARASSGGPFASVEKLRIADDKAQALFENCFRVLNGPDAPNVKFQELDQELVLYLDNPSVSNNFNEEYEEVDPFIITPDSLRDLGQFYDNTYNFEGYQIYQVRNEDVSVNEILNADKSRLVAQCDVKNGITQLVNYEFNEKLQANVPTEMVDGQDNGVQHSFKITEDQFASGDRKLVNHKTYYFIAVAYGSNNFKKFNNQDPQALDGQKKPYIGSRRGIGGAVQVWSAIPHIPSPEKEGTVAASDYGDAPMITRVEGTGNGGMNLDITSATEEVILAAPYKMDFPEYAAGGGPIDIKVVDPLNVPEGDFRVTFRDSATPGDLTDAYWVIHNLSTGDSVLSDKSIAVANEQLILDWGISVAIGDVLNPGLEQGEFLSNGFIEATLTFKDSTKRWLSGFSDVDGATDLNWIRAGTAENNEAPASDYNDYKESGKFVDEFQKFETMLDGEWAPYRLAAYSGVNVNHGPAYDNLACQLSKLSDLPSVDIVFTSDKSKWTRCPVLETQDDNALAEGNTGKLKLRSAQSVDKDGNPDGTGTGMGWFPGYAIDLESGVRLNMAFGEDSWLGGENGRDMMWNPTETDFAGVANEIRWGGKHYVYVFKYNPNPVNSNQFMPEYDAGVYLQNKIPSAVGSIAAFMWSQCAYVGIPVLEDGQSLLSTDARVRIRVNREYEAYATSSTVNAGLPMYDFNMDDLATTTKDATTAKEALELINCVPNPYYAYSEYERSKLDNIMKITNLPEECTVTIYNVGGTLVRRYAKSDPGTSLNWDLKNTKGVPVASGVYLIHVDVPGVGEVVLKWFGVMRPTDVSDF